jgi:hypothetical protein
MMGVYRWREKPEISPGRATKNGLSRDPLRLFALGVEKR